jgi:hypothetical protein
MNNENATSFKKFDLACFSVLAAISEIMSHGLLNVWNSGFYFSFSTVLCLIAMLRWGSIGIIPGVLGGIFGIFFSEMDLWNGLLYYGVANLFLVVPMLIYGKRDRDRISRDSLWLLLYILLSHVCLSVGKGLAIFLITGEVTGCVDYFGATFLILVMNGLICLVLKMREGLICDMRNYFNEGEGN